VGESFHRTFPRAEDTDCIVRPMGKLCEIELLHA